MVSTILSDFMGHKEMLISSIIVLLIFSFPTLINRANSQDDHILLVLELTNIPDNPNNNSIKSYNITGIHSDHIGFQNIDLSNNASNYLTKYNDVIVGECTFLITDHNNPNLQTVKNLDLGLSIDYVLKPSNDGTRQYWAKDTSGFPSRIGQLILKEASLYQYTNNSGKLNLYYY